MSLTPLTGLPVPQFVDRDPQAIVEAMVAQYEAMAGRTLYPAQVERLQIDLTAYRETLTREAIQDAALQNLLAFARGHFLDYLGDLQGCRRLGGAKARALLRFAFAVPLPATVLIPAGTRVQDSGRSFTFIVLADTPVAAGVASVETWAEATETGPRANGLTTGQLSVLLDTFGVAATVANITPSYGGASAEPDERYRERIRLASERPACGSLGAYRYNALTTHPDVVAVGLDSVRGGEVRVSAITADGGADAGLMNALMVQLNREDLRPATDHVVVLAAERVPYRIEARLTLYAGVSQAEAQRAAVERLEAHAAQHRRSLGRDVVPSQVSERLQSLPGVYRVELVQPSLRVLTAHQWADCEAIEVTIAGVADG